MNQQTSLIPKSLTLSAASEQFRQYVKALGRGQRASRDLTQDEALDAMKLVLSGEIATEQLGAFLMLLRIKEETSAELAGFTYACRHYCEQPTQPLDFDLDIGCYAGKRRHQPWLVLAMLLVAQSGKKIVVHGSQEPDSNRFYVSRVFSELGLPIATDVNQIQSELAKTNLCYVPLHVISPQMQHLIELRRLFSLRSPINTVARMLNPFGCDNSVHGVFHRHFDERHAEACSLLNDNRVSCFRGEGGEVEFNPEREWTVYQSTRGVVTTQTMPAVFEHAVVKPREINTQSLLDVWRDETQDDYADAAIIGTAAIYLANLDENLDVPASLELATTLWQNRDKSAL